MSHAGLPCACWRWVPFHGAKLSPNPYKSSGSQQGWSKGQATWKDPGATITWDEVTAWFEADPTRTCSLTIARELAWMEKTWGR